MRKLAIMLSALLALPAIAAADTAVIDQISMTWAPDEITINLGDTVEWHWSSLSHTVTNGTGAADPDAGTLFDAPLNGSSPVFSFTFTATGDYPYFCRPHEPMGMTGIIHVVDETAVDPAALGNIKALY